MNLADGTGAVWYSEDNANTFSEAIGVKGVPVCITHNGDTYFMTTRDGVIQKSADYGKTWQTVFELSGGISPFSLDNGSPLEGIRFSDENNGIATGVGCIYVTADGGDTWEKREIKAANNLTVWNDVAYVDGNIVIVGSDGNICSSEDGGTTWTPEYIDGETTNELSCAFVTSEGLTIGGSESTIIHKGTADIKHAYNAAVYNMESETWTDMEHSGYFCGLGDPDPIEAGSASAADDISGDGSTVVGIVENFKKYNDESAIHGEAAAWVNGKLNILGSKFADRNRASRATKASYDGSVIVGWQDIMGPWYGQVWTKNATGGYDRKMVFVDDKMTEDDITEWPTGGPEAMRQYGETFVGLCNAVSSDGKWIGGRGGGNWYTGIGGAWLRNLETGETKTITNDDDTVYDMTNDASFVVGQAGPGMSSWIWTEEAGKKEINDYVTTDLGIDLGNFIICGVMDLSPNGRYICGWGMEGEGKFAYMVDLKGNVQSSIEKDLEQTKAAVYPNPVADELHIDLPFDEVTTRISLYDMQGAMVKTMTVNSQNNIMNVSDVHPGLYILNVNANGTKKSFKLQIKH